MQISFPFTNILNLRSKYLDRIQKDLESYNPDSKDQLRGYLPKINVMAPTLHELIAGLDDKQRSSHKENSPNKQEHYSLYKEIKTQLIDYIQIKKQNLSPQKLICFDIWTKIFPQAENAQKAQNLLNVSDQVEDFLWLADVVSHYELDEENVHLTEEITKIISNLPDYLLLIEDSLIEEIKKLLKNIEHHYLSKEYKQSIEKINELKKIIRI